MLAEGLAARLAFRSHRTGHESILVLAGSPSEFRVKKSSPIPWIGLRFLRHSNSLFSIVRMFKITLHVKAVARRDIFLLGAVDHGVLLGR